METIKKYALEKMTDEIYEAVIKEIKRLNNEYNYDDKATLDILLERDTKYPGYTMLWDDINDKLIDILGE